MSRIPSGGTRRVPREASGRLRRRRIDVVTAVIGCAVLAAGVALSRGGAVGGLEPRVFRVVNGLPGALYPFLFIPMQLGAFIAVDRRRAGWDSCSWVSILHWTWWAGRDSASQRAPWST